MKRLFLTLALVATLCANAQQSAAQLIDEAKAMLDKNYDDYRASEKLRKAIKLDPDNYDAYYLLALYAIRTGDSRTSAQQFTRALEIKPDDPQATWGLSIAMVNRAQTPEEFKAARERLLYVKSKGWGDPAKLEEALRIADEGSGSPR